MLSAGVISERLSRLLYPQTLLIVGVLTGTMVLLAILVRIRATYAFDLKATLALQESDHPALTKAMRWMTFMGNSLTLVILAGGVLVICWYARELAAGILACASLISLPINMILKNMFDRERPGENEVRVVPGPRWGFSFPSGHAMGSAAFYGFLAFLFHLHIINPTARALAVAVCILLPTFVGVSRIYLGAHWLSDVVGGWALGMVVVIVLASVFTP